MSIRLYVGNLPKELDREELQAVFQEAGDFVSTKVITDRKTGKCRGFGFVTVKTPEQADEVVEKFNGYLFKDNPLKVEKALPRSKGKAEEESKASGAAPNNGGGKGGNRKGGGKKSRRSSHSPSQSNSVQPDPRWAEELEKLKEMLAAQTANS